MKLAKVLVCGKGNRRYPGTRQYPATRKGIEAAARDARSRGAGFTRAQVREAARVAAYGGHTLLIAKNANLRKVYNVNVGESSTWVLGWGVPASVKGGA